MLTDSATRFSHRPAIRDDDGGALTYAALWREDDALVPALARLWAAARQWDPSGLESLRLLQVGGARLAEADARAAQRAFPGTLQQVFGMAGGLVCSTRPGDTSLPVGQEGELLVRGPYTPCAAIIPAAL